MSDWQTISPHGMPVHHRGTSVTEPKRTSYLPIVIAVVALALAGASTTFALVSMSRPVQVTVKEPAPRCHTEVASIEERMNGVSGRPYAVCP